MSDEEVNVNMENNHEDTNVDEKHEFPSFFVQNDDHIRIEIDVLFDKSNGRMINVHKHNPSFDYEAINGDAVGVRKEWFDFSPVTYDQLAGYKEQCNVYNRQFGGVLTDPVKLRSYLLVRHLKDWSLTDRNGEKVEITTDDSGNLDKESSKKVSNVHHSLLDKVITLFQQELMI